AAHRGGGRAGLGTGRFDPGAGAESVDGPARRVPPRLPVHQPRPLGGPPYRARRAGDVLRPDGGAWTEAERVRDAATSVYTHAAGGDPVARSGAAQGGGGGEGRAAFADRSAHGLCVRVALSACDGTVCGGAAGAASARRGAGRLSPRRGNRLSAISPRRPRAECAPTLCRVPG